MANIAITNFCNLKCSYCFADDMICEEKKHITIDQFKKILKWISKTPKNRIGIIGGEPTLHPYFKEILNEVNIYCRDCNSTATLFTNGIYLDKYIPEIGDAINVLINCNNPDSMTVEQEKMFFATLDHLDILGWFRRKTNCGCNLHIGTDDYSYIWKIVKKYKLQNLRVSVTAPGGQYTDWRKDKEGYYKAMVPIWVKFCKEALEHNIKLSPDCNHIPECYLTDEEIQLQEKVLRGKQTHFCQPVVDITPDFRATACFGSYDPVDCEGFDDLIELERYLAHKKSYPRYCANSVGRCATCKNHELMKCQGGCLGFAEV